MERSAHTHHHLLEAQATTFPTLNAGGPTTLPDLEEVTDTKTRDQHAPRYKVIVWNDPINEMRYVTHVFQRVFGWDRQKAEKHMLEVHQEGKSVVAIESMEKAELYVHQLQAFTLHATMELDA